MPADRSRSPLTAPLSEAALLLLALGPTLALGGVYRSVQLVAGVLGAAGLMLVYLHRRGRGIGLHLPLFGWALAGLTALTLLQLVPLPLGMLRLVAPASVEVMEISMAKVGGVPSWHPISLDPGSTLWEALKLGLYACAFIAGHNFYYRRERRHRLFLALVGVGVVMMFLALVGAVVAPGKPLLLYTPEAGRATGLIATSFVNPNHSAGFFTLGALLALGLAFDSQDLQRKVLLGLGAVVLGLGVMLTVSRGGILALAIGMAALSVMIFMARRRTDLGQAAVIVPTVLALVLLLAGGLEYERLSEELSQFSPGDQGSLGKIAQWPAGVAMALANPWVGVGRGAFMTAFPRYMRGDIPANTYEYMENQFIQLPVEFGLPVGLIFMVLAAVCWLGWLRRGRSAGKTMAAAAALLALAAHNLVDFSFEMIGLGLPLCLVAGALSAATLRRRGRERSTSSDGRASRRRRRQVGTAAGLGVAGVTALLGGICLGSWPTLPRDDDQLLASLAGEKVPLARYTAAADEAIRRHPSDYMPHLGVAHQAMRVGDPRAIAALNRALFLFPRSPRIHLEAARALLRFGGRGQALLEYRLAMEHGALPEPVLRESIPLCTTTGELRTLLPDRPDIHALALRWLRLAKRLDLARPAADRALKLWPADLRVCIKSAEVLLAQEDKGALAAARRCVDLNPTLAAYRVLAGASALLGSDGSEIPVLMEGLKRFGDSMDLIDRLARAYLHHGDHAQAMKTGERMLRLAGRWQDRARAHRVMARIQKEMGNAHTAQYHLTQAEALRRSR